jgi:beta-1,4-mannosyltransferase
VPEDARLRVAAFPTDQGAPYLRLLHSALARAGVEIVTRPSLRAALDGKPLDAVHLHWLEYLIGGDRARAYVRGLRLAGALRRLRRSGTRVVWTVHNLRPHERRHRRLEDHVARATLRCADNVVVHSPYAARRVAETYGGAGKLAVVPHGNFIGFYPPPSRSRAQTRAALGLAEDAFVYLIFGQLRAYKRIPEALRAFRSLPDPDARLLVAGAPHDAALRAQIEAAADERVVLRLGHVPDDEVAELHAAADAALLPYRQVFSSGALLLALSLGLPAVVPAEGADDVAGPPATQPFEEGELLAALAAVRVGDPDRRRRLALEAADRYDWDAIAAYTKELYEGGRPERAPAVGALSVEGVGA